MLPPTPDNSKYPQQMQQQFAEADAIRAAGVTAQPGGAPPQQPGMAPAQPQLGLAPAAPQQPAPQQPVMQFPPVVPQTAPQQPAPQVPAGQFPPVIPQTAPQQPQAPIAPPMAPPVAGAPEAPAFVPMPGPPTAVPQQPAPQAPQAQPAPWMQQQPQPAGQPQPVGQQQPVAPPVPPAAPGRPAQTPADLHRAQLEFDNRQLQEQIKALQNPTQTEAPKPFEMTEEEKAAHADQMPFLERLVGHHTQPLVEKLTATQTELARLRGVEQEVVGVGQAAKAARDSAFYGTLEQQIPNFSMLAQDPQFAAYLDTPNRYTGAPTRQLLALAEQNYDVTSWTTIVGDYLTSRGTTAQNAVAPIGQEPMGYAPQPVGGVQYAQQPQPVGAAQYAQQPQPAGGVQYAQQPQAMQTELQAMVAPDLGRTAPVPNQATGEVISMAQIAAVQAAITRGDYSRQEGDQLMTRIHSAYAEGRVTP